MFREIDIRSIEKSPVKMISDEWALLTAGTLDSYNTMTVSWGALGELWGRDCAFAFVRPQRYTYEFMEKNDYYTLTFFDGGYKKEMGFCGSHSGRDVDKAAATGLEPVSVGEGVSFVQAKTVLVCKKIAVQDINPDGFLDESINGEYPINDYHRVYIGEIVKVLRAE